MSTSSSEDRPPRRYRRPAPRRTGPQRRVGGAFATPGSRSTAPPPDRAPAPAPAPASGPRDFVENGVKTGYQVFESYLARGEQAARQFESARDPWSAAGTASNPFRMPEADMSDRTRRALGFDPRQGAQDLARLWINGWLKAMELVVGPLGHPRDLAQAGDMAVPPELQRMMQEGGLGEDWWKELDARRAATSSDAQSAGAPPPASTSHGGWRPSQRPTHVDPTAVYAHSFDDEPSWEYRPETDRSPAKVRRPSRHHQHRTRTITTERFEGIQLIGPDGTPLVGCPAAMVELFHHVRFEVETTKLKLRAATTVASVEGMLRKGPKPRATLPPRTLSLEKAGERWVLTGNLPPDMEPGDWEAKVRDRKTGRYTGEVEIRVHDREAAGEDESSS